MRLPHRNHPDVQAWLPVIGRYKLLTAAEERDLGRRVRAGCAEARDTMVTANLGLVVMVAGRFRSRGLEFSELISEGNVGLLRAVVKFDPDVGCRFSTYGVWWIEQSIRRALQRSRPIRQPAYMQARVAEWRAATRDLTTMLGREPLSGEVARQVGLDETMAAGVVAALATAGRRHLPLDVTPDGEEDRPGDSVPDPADQPWETADAALQLERIAGLLDVLDERSRTVLELRYGLGRERAMTLMEVGAVLHVTRERVRQLQLRALQSLRDAARRCADERRLAG